MPREPKDRSIKPDDYSALLGEIRGLLQTARAAAARASIISKCRRTGRSASASCAGERKGHTNAKVEGFYDVNHSLSFMPRGYSS